MKSIETNGCYRILLSFEDYFFRNMNVASIVVQIRTNCNSFIWMSNCCYFVFEI